MTHLKFSLRRHTRTEVQSRGLILNLDERARTARLAQALYHPTRLSASSMGSVQILPGGRFLVGWGSEPYVDEYASDGTLLADARLAPRQQCYRSFRLPWSGHPERSPAVRATRHTGRATSTLYASWNGSTEVAFWRVHAGAHRSALRPIGTGRVSSRTYG